jgi:hypothetical protein
MPGGSQFRSCGRAEPAPSAGVSPARMALRRKARDVARGGFLGGTRSPRPQIRAGRMARHCVATGAFTMSRWPGGGNVGVGVMSTSRACGARPSEARASRRCPALRDEAPRMRGRWFSRRGAVSAPGWQGRRRAGVWRDYGRVGERPVAEWGDVSVGVMPTLRACGARPSEGVSPARMPLRRKARDVARGGFLGGARSPRPGGKAGRKPGRVMIAGDKRRTEGPGETCRGEAISVPLGRAEPAPPPGMDAPRRDGLAGKGPGITRRAIFSEGRALRVRVVRP